MRALALPSLLALACSSTPSLDAPVDASVEVTSDVVLVDTSPQPQCPAPLGAPRPRPPRAPAGPMDDVLRVNHLQLKATHNSYHLRPENVIPQWDYSHAPLDQQLDRQGVRGVELDLHWNTPCARYEVYHLGGIDPQTTCRVFTDCLDVIRRWSDAHAAHHVLFVHLEHKDNFAAEVLDARLDAMEREILSVWSREQVVTPDEVRGASTTLADGIRAHGWPTLGATRGRVLFYLDRTDALRTAYTHGGRDLTGRLAFVDSAITDPFAGVLVLNNPSRLMDIQAAVRAGFLVRVFSWSASDTEPAYAPENAMATGAQIVSTDFPAAAPGVTRVFEIQGGNPSRCNPLTAPMGCTAAAVESLPR